MCFVKTSYPDHIVIMSLWCVYFQNSDILHTGSVSIHVEKTYAELGDDDITSSDLLNRISKFRGGFLLFLFSLLGFFVRCCRSLLQMQNYTEIAYAMKTKPNHIRHCPATFLNRHMSKKCILSGKAFPVSHRVCFLSFPSHSFRPVFKCGGNLDSDSGFVASEDFPSYYKPNSKCTWYITVSGNSCSSHSWVPWVCVFLLNQIWDTKEHVQINLPFTSQFLSVGFDGTHVLLSTLRVRTPSINKVEKTILLQHGKRAYLELIDFKH